MLESEVVYNPPPVYSKALSPMLYTVAQSVEADCCVSVLVHQDCQWEQVGFIDVLSFLSIKIIGARFYHLPLISLLLKQQYV